jgi:hypothetical protein
MTTGGAMVRLRPVLLLGSLERASVSSLERLLSLLSHRGVPSLRGEHDYRALERRYWIGAPLLILPAAIAIYALSFWLFKH